MRICIFTDSFLPYCSGVTYAVRNQANELARRGNQVWILRPRPWREDRSELEDMHANVRVWNAPVSLPVPHVAKLHITLPTFFSTWRSLRRIRPDVVHLNTEWGCGWEGVVAARWLGVPAVGTFHTFFAEPGYLKALGLPNLSFIRKMMWNYSVFFYSWCHALTSPSLAVKNALMQNGVRREPHVVSNGINPPQLRPQHEIDAMRQQIGTDCPTFVYVGRISPEKSLDVLLNAFAHVVEQRPDARLLLVGDGPFRPKLKRMIRDLKLADCVRDLGYVPHEELIQRNIPRGGDVFVTASKTENQPLSILEAMSFGLPVVGPRAKGIPELVCHGVDGALFTPDDEREMAECMLQAIGDKKRLAMLSRNAGATACDHSISRTAEHLEQVYKEAIRVAQGRPLRKPAIADNRAPGASSALDRNQESLAPISDPRTDVPSAVGRGDF